MKKQDELYNISMHERGYYRVSTARRAKSKEEAVRKALQIIDNFDKVFELDLIEIKKSEE